MATTNEREKWEKNRLERASGWRWRRRRRLEVKGPKKETGERSSLRIKNALGGAEGGAGPERKGSGHIGSKLSGTVIPCRNVEEVASLGNKHANIFEKIKYAIVFFVIETVLIYL